MKTVPCASGRMRSWTVHGIGNVSRAVGVDGMPPQVVVSRAGTATVAWSEPTGAGSVIRAAEDPPVPGDPQDPTHGGQSSPSFGYGWSDLLGIDAADAQTLVYLDSRGLTGDGISEAYDLVISDRASGAEWSRSPTKVRHRILEFPQLAVNASGAAVVMWSEYVTRDGNPRLFASYRDTAGAKWTSPERVPAPNAFMSYVDIDDAGRVLLVYDRIDDKKEGVWAIRRTPTGRWGKRRHLSGRNTEWFSTALGAGGAAVVTYGHVDGDGRSNGPQVTSRMSPAGTWGAPVRQPEGLHLGPVDIDAKGRALLTGWHGTDLMGRWSRPDGRWRKPFVVAADVSKPRWYLLKAVLNRRGDALVTWRAKSRVEQLWARYQPAGQEWTKPVKVTRADSPPRWSSAALGDCGHAAVAWTTRNNIQVQLRRASPTP